MPRGCDSGWRDVVINGRFLSKPQGGVARVGTELLRALEQELRENAPEIRLRIATAPGASAVPGAPGSHGNLVRTRGFAGRLGEQLGLPVLYPGATILSFCNVTPVLARRSVVWIHDAQIFDAPDTYGAAYRLWHRGIFAAARWRGFEIATVSHFARSRLLHHGANPDRVRVMHNGGDHILRNAPDGAAARRAGLEQQPYVLVVGSPARHKNVPFALRALLAGGAPGLKIAVVGLAQAGAYLKAEGLPDDARIVLLPQVSDGELRALYAGARVVVVPSLFEGFGLYAAEAMFADSGPLVLSARTSLPEVGGDAALFFDPTDPESLRAAVRLALEPATATRLRAAARVQREQFRWRRTARTVIATYLR
jgi:glycosyltransferase involved in cell wall biosynthesis